MVTCPWCGKAAMTIGRKIRLGPERIERCAACGRPVALHWTYLLAATPAFLGGLAMMRAESTAAGLAAAAAGIVAMGLLHAFVIPLVPKA